MSFSLTVKSLPLPAHATLLCVRACVRACVCACAVCVFVQAHKYTSQINGEIAEKVREMRQIDDTLASL